MNISICNAGIPQSFYYHVYENIKNIKKLENSAKVNKISY